MDETKAPRVVHVDVALPKVELPPKAARVVVRVEDISKADAASEVVGEARQSEVSLKPGDPLRLSIEIPRDRINEQRRYSVAAHVDISGSGEVEVGDFVSTQSYPVLTRGGGDRVRVDVKRVG
jgi:uncharacterized lipoprotein YbaY